MGSGRLSVPERLHPEYQVRNQTACFFYPSATCTDTAPRGTDAATPAKGGKAHSLLVLLLFCLCKSFKELASIRHRTCFLSESGCKGTTNSWNNKTFGRFFSQKDNFFRNSWQKSTEKGKNTLYILRARREKGEKNHGRGEDALNKYHSSICSFWISVLVPSRRRFAAKWVAFCRKMENVWPKMERVLAQNGMRFGPKWEAFWPKMENAYAPNALHLCVFTSMKHCLSPTIRLEREEAKLDYINNILYNSIIRLQ